MTHEKFCKILADQPKKIRKMQLKEEKEITRQTRSETTKKVWMSDGTVRKMLSITGARSEVSVFSDRRTPRIVETFYEVTGIIQEQLLFQLADGREIMSAEMKMLPQDTPCIPIQRFRYFEADKAVYDFSLKSLVATNIHFWTYIAQGHDLIENFDELVSSAEGYASRMTILSGTNDDGQFFAEDLKLNIKGDKGV